MGGDVASNDRCCGESGTLAATRPDISTPVRFRKEEMRTGVAKIAAGGFAGEVKVLTSCPSCLQGLSRYDGDAGTTADCIVVELASHLLGAHWMADYVAKANNGGIERVLLETSRLRTAHALACKPVSMRLFSGSPGAGPGHPGNGRPGWARREVANGDAKPFTMSAQRVVRCFRVAAAQSV